MAGSPVRRRRTPSQDVRRTLLVAATEVLEEGGLGAVTVRAVASRAGTALQSVYNHFGDKQGLLAAIAEDHFAALARRLAAITEPDPMERLRAGYLVVRELMTAHPRSYELMWSTPPGPATRDAFTQLMHLIEYAQAARVVTPGDPTTLASALWAAIYGAITIEVNQGDAPRETGVTRIDFDVVLRLLEDGLRVR